MKKIQTLRTFLLSLIMMVIMAGCTKVEKKEGSIFSAKIENPNGDTLSIQNPSYREELATLQLSNGVLEKQNISLPMGYYQINDGKEITMIFWKKDYNLHLSLNTKEFDETIKYSGTGTGPNNYLAKKYLLEESFADRNHYGYYANLSEEKFLLFVDSVYSLNVDLFNENKQNFDKDFLKLEYIYLKLDRLNKITDYESIHRYLTGNKDFKVSDKFPDPFEDVELNDEELLGIPNYLQFVESYLRYLTNEQRGKDSSTPFYNAFLTLMDSEIKNKIVKERVAYYFSLSGFKRVKDKQFCYEKFKKMISNSKYLKPIEDTYSKLNKTEKGSVSPLFELYDIDSNLVKLEDFKGKIVYIDNWATWCSPCIAEIPHLEKLQEEYKDKNIVFISICKSDKKENWVSFVREKELNGVQLFAPDDKIKFFTDYMVTSIPRFILIDEEGLIIDPEASRPSFPELKKQLDKLL